MIKLDLTKQHGTIAGTYSAIPEAKYSQNGKFFNASGAQVFAAEEKQPEQPKQPEQTNANVVAEEPQTVTTKAPELPATNQTNELAMEKTDDELAALSAAGMSALRAYADPFGVKGTSKSEIIEDLIKLR